MVSKSVIYCSVCMAAVAAELWSDHQHPHFEMRMPQGHGELRQAVEGRHASEDGRPHPGPRDSAVRGVAQAG